MYNIKVYSQQGAFKKTLNPSKVDCTYSISIAKDIGWGDFSFTYYGVGLDHTDIVRVYREANLVYEGYIDGITRIIDEKGERYNIACTGMVGLLAFIKHGKQNYNTSADEIIRAIFQKASDYGYDYDLSGVETIPGTIDIETNEDETCMGALRKVMKNTKSYFFVTDKVYLKQTGSHHILTFQNDVASITMEEDSRNLINEYEMKDKNNHQASALDTESQQRYGKRYQYSNQPEITSMSSLQNKIDKELEENSLPKLNTKIQVNRKYPLETIAPGDTIEIRNIEIEIQNKPIEKLSYTPDYVTIDVDGVIDFNHTIASLKKSV